MPRRNQLKVQFSASPGLRRWFIRAVPAIERRVQKRNVLHAFKVRDRARYYCPVRRGVLRSSITARTDSRRLTWTVFCDPEVFANIPTGAEEPYDLYVEFGTRYMSGRFFMTRAYAENIIQYHAGLRADIMLGMRDALRGG